MISGAALTALIVACAPGVHPNTMARVVEVESKGDPLALNVNKVEKQPAKATSATEAAATARRYMAMGYSTDIGLGQINSKNLPALGLTVEEVLDPCTNLRAAETILASAYRDASEKRGEGHEALLAALSAYNTGSFTRGFLNGYVAKYHVATVNAAPQPLPAARVHNAYAAQLQYAMEIGEQE